MKSLLVVLAIMLMSATAWASECTLTWDPPDPPSDPVGYKIHYGEASGSYTKEVQVGDLLTATVQGLGNGKTYYFAATALYDDGQGGFIESGYSNEVSKFLPELVPPGGLRITGIKLNIEIEGE